MPLTRAAILAALLLGAMHATRARAQTHVLEAAIPISSASARDDLLVPVAATGLLLGLASRYRLGLASERFEAELGLSAAIMFDHYGNAAVQIPHTLALGYAHVVQRSASALMMLGVNARWSTEISYFAAWDDAHGYWLSMLALGPTMRHAATIGQSVVLETGAELALLGLSSRPPRYRFNKQDALTQPGYYLDRLGDAEPFWLWDVQALRVEALLRARTSHAAYGTGFGAGGYARLARASEPEPYTVLYVGVLLDYGWQL